MRKIILKRLTVALPLLFLSFSGISAWAMSKPMTKYQVEAASFYSTFSYEKACPDCHRTMPSLIDRYQIKHKEVISIGPGTGHEEYYFLADQNHLTFVDIDESHGIEKHLKVFAEQKPLTQPTIDYFIGDFTTQDMDTTASHLFDVVFMSGYTPHSMWLLEVTTNPEFNHWNEPNSTLEPSIEKAIKNYVKPNGLLIIQLYHGSPDATNSAYVQRLKSDLKLNHMTLLELYHLKEAPGVQLIVAMKAPESKALAYYQNNIKSRTPLIGFHGRAAYDKFDIVLRYALDD